MKSLKSLNNFCLILLRILLIVVFSFMKSEKRLNKNRIKKYRYLKFI